MTAAWRVSNLVIYTGVRKLGGIIPLIPGLYYSFRVFWYSQIQAVYAWLDK
jgi:hypothetical protein